ncbi:cytochrome P450 [Paraburkholderia sp. NMBU_R16]|uniref:cytochrome P450 n=1 Tax=Paraburkholderia sp. NMBU_R16 TaxID=2698676 RepID=UPI0015656D9A|nr:cytochrome P450 [Paraburkholderia sp. NMBU_R16]NRO99496.1 cytochrome P450 [Paraburkholderia sp. NMBU_R16]
MNVRVAEQNSLSSEKVVVALKPTLAANSAATVQIDGVELTVVRTAECIAIFEGRCPHQGSLLSEGSINASVLTCRGHGWQFDCASGRGVGGTVNDLKRFEAFVDGDRIMVDRSEVLAWKARCTSGGNVPKAQAVARLRSIDQLPGPKGLPWVGSLFHLAPKKLHLTLEAWCSEFGPMYAYKVMNRPFVVIAEAQLVGQILRRRPDHYRRWSAFELIMTEIGTNGVFSAEGDAWRRQRPLVAKALGASCLRGFFPSLHEILARLHGRWRNAALRNVPVDIQNDLMRYTVDVTASLAFSYDMNTIESDGDILQTHLARVFPALNNRLYAPFPYWRYVKMPSDRALDRSLSAVRRFISDLIASNRSRLAQHPRDGSQPRNLLEALLGSQEEGQAPLTDDEIFANVFTLLLAGEDTTANTIAWMTHFMCSNAAVQRKMQDEVDAVLGTEKLLTDPGQADKLTYIDAVANETMRLKPVAPFLVVEPLNDVELDGVSVPKGTIIILLTRYPNLLEQHYVRAQTFDPDRWIAEGENALPRDARFVAFGSGPRYCPGRNLAMLEIKCAIAMLCRNFHLSVSPACASVEERLSFTMMPHGLRLNFVTRD